MGLVLREIKWLKSWRFVRFIKIVIKDLTLRIEKPMNQIQVHYKYGTRTQFNFQDKIT